MGPVGPVWKIKGQSVPLTASSVGGSWIDLRARLGEDCVCIRTSFCDGRFRATAYCNVDGLDETLVILGRDLGCIESAIKWINAETARLSQAVSA